MQNIAIFQPFDILVALFYLAILISIAVLIRNSRYQNDGTKNYFLPALGVKLFGGIAMALYYYFFVGSGDTFSYFNTTTVLFDVAMEDIDFLLDVMTFKMTDKGYQPLINENSELFYRYMYQNMQVSLRDEYAFSVVRLTLPISLISFGSYFAANLITSFFSFLGVWAMFRVFYSYYPALHKPLAIAVLFLPSMWFWGSGILKDSWTIGALGLLTYSIDRIFIKRQFKAILLLVAVFCGYVIFSIKPYILLSYLAFVFLWVGLSFRDGIRRSPLRVVLMPVLFAALIGSGVIILTSLSQLTTRYSVETVLDSAQIVQEDLAKVDYYEDGQGSKYDIGKIEPTVTGILSLFPNAVIATFFRPFLWEVRNPAMLFSALEGIFFILLTLRVLFRVGLFQMLAILYRNSFLIFMLGYGITFAFMVGLTSGNFGNLVRYKIPCLPFFLGAMLVIEYIGYTKPKQDAVAAAEGEENTVALSKPPIAPIPNTGAR